VRTTRPHSGKSTPSLRTSGCSAIWPRVEVRQNLVAIGGSPWNRPRRGICNRRGVGFFGHPLPSSNGPEGESQPRRPNFFVAPPGLKRRRETPGPWTRGERLVPAMPWGPGPGRGRAPRRWRWYRPETVRPASSGRSPRRLAGLRRRFFLDRRRPSWVDRRTPWPLDAVVTPAGPTGRSPLPAEAVWSRRHRPTNRGPGQFHLRGARGERGVPLRRTPPPRDTRFAGGPWPAVHPAHPGGRGKIGTGRRPVVPVGADTTASAAGIRPVGRPVNDRVAAMARSRGPPRSPAGPSAIQENLPRTAQAGRGSPRRWMRKHTGSAMIETRYRKRKTTATAMARHRP